MQIDGRQVDEALGGRQCRVLLAYLALHRTRAVRRDELIEALWPDGAPADPAAALNTLVSRLRKVLGSELVSGRSELRLSIPEAAEVDVETAFHAVLRAELALERADWGVGEAAAQAALDIVEAGFLPEAVAPWVDEERRRIEELRLRALECLAACGLGIGGLHLSATERAAATLIAIAPYRETGYRFMMQALGERGRIAEALQVFDDFRVLLQEQLGTAPGAGLRSLHERLLNRQELASHSEREDPLAVGTASSAVLVSGVVAADEAGRAAHARIVRSAVGTYGGREAPVAGDGVAAVFRSAANAMSCAVLMQQTAERFRRRSPERALGVRVGVGVGDPMAWDENVAGAGGAVSRAQQLCECAQAGQILVARQLAAATSTAVAHVFRDPAGGGPSAPVELTWQPVPERPFALPAGLSNGDRGAFVGRLADLEHLERAYRRAVAGRRQLALVCGEPGIGKTRLASELAVRAHDDGAIVLYGRCDEEPLLPHQPFVEALRQYVAAAWLPELVGQLRPISGELRRVLPELAERLPDVPEPLAGDLEGARYRLFEAFSALLSEAAAVRPLVLVIDDLHWADPPSLLLLTYLMRYPRDASLLVLGTYRDTEIDREHPFAAALADLSREHAIERRALARLDADAVARLVDAKAGDQASPELARTVYERTEGNPFFVVETLRHLEQLDRGAVTSGSRCWPCPTASATSSAGSWRAWASRPGGYSPSPRWRGARLSSRCSNASPTSARTSCSTCSSAPSEPA